MASINDLPAGPWTVDASHSVIGFTARHLMVTKVRGQFTDYTADINVADPATESTVNVVVQLASIETGAADRDTHLRSADFFDTENNPTMTFTSTKITEDSMTGDLTIKGVTKPVTFDLEFNGVQTDPWGGQRAGFEATADVNRKDWGLEWNVALEGGGVLVSDKIKLALDVELVKA
ncbi:YceI family protein [Knoellia koreensis]|uniref:Polyisoprenoid-binding protein n=1 Tax=Knoellia koreensis TaxID=2730921 RepID=A0A849HLP3_9MICO|nr:YceI family protein [Knoellia sp. DB2414S]NNM47593.1 polyisoprenoid-binding protein [Knoellia sp. DB2414S]